MLRSLLVLTLLLAGCPESQTTDKGLDPVTGKPPGEGTPGEAPPGGGTPPTEAKVEPGQGVMVSGTFAYEGDAKGTYRIDITSQGTADAPSQYARTTLAAPGPWQIEVPKNMGAVTVLGFIEQGQGPGGGTPSMTIYGLTVGESPLADVALAPVAGGSILGTPPAGTPMPPGSGAQPPTDGAPPADPAAGSAPPAGAPPSMGGAPADGTAPPAGAPPAGAPPAGATPAPTEAPPAAPK